MVMICTACFADPNKSRNAGSESMSGSGPGKHVDRPGEVTRGPMVKSLVSKSLVSLVSKAPGLLRCSTPAHYLKKKKRRSYGLRFYSSNEELFLSWGKAEGDWTKSRKCSLKCGEHWTFQLSQHYQQQWLVVSEKKRQSMSNFSSLCHPKKFLEKGMVHKLLLFVTEMKSSSL